MDKNEVADVLETAARLYRDEKINWCQGAWREVPENGTQKMSACAEGALMRACGFTWQQVGTIGGFVYQYQPQVERTIKAQDRYLAAEKALQKTPEGRAGIVNYNDADGDRTKEDIIDWFEATAKDLRNDK